MSTPTTIAAPVRGGGFAIVRIRALALELRLAPLGCEPVETWRRSACICADGADAAHFVAFPAEHGRLRLLAASAEVLWRCRHV